MTTEPIADDILRLERAEEAMGTTFSVVLHGDEPSRLEQAAHAAFEEIHRLDRMLSNYQPASEWSSTPAASGRD